MVRRLIEEEEVGLADERAPRAMRLASPPESPLTERW